MTPDQKTLVRNYVPLVRGLARKHSPPAPWTTEDLVSAGFEGLCKAAVRWDERKQATFATFATNHILGAFKDELRSLGFGSRALKRVEQPCTFSNEMLQSSLLSYEEDFTHLNVQNVMTVLTEQERAVFKMRMAGVKGEEIGAALGVGQSRVTQIRSEAVRKLRQLRLM